MTGKIIGIDVGTQSLKATVVEGDLRRVLGSASRCYDTHYPRPGWAEQDPRSWESALAPAIAEALAGAGAGPGDVSVIGVTGQLDGCVAVDNRNRPLGPCLIWQDRRADLPPGEGLAARIRDRCGIVSDPGHMAAKIRWLKANNAGRAACFHQPVSYMIARLTGREVMDYSLASTTMLYELNGREWSAALLDVFGIDAAELPELADAGEPAGVLTETGARLTGLAQGIPVAVGTGDDFTAALGAGIVRPGRLACVVGTAEVVGALDNDAKIDETGLLETHAYMSGGYFLENPGWSAGGAVQWFIRNHRLDGPAEFDHLASQAPPGSDGVLFLPALSGAMAPEWNSRARACFYGLTAAHGLPHMARAVMEGCAFAMRDVVQRLRELGVPLEAIRLAGGGARSRLWAQIRADAVQLPAQVVRDLDTAPLGAAMLAAMAAGNAPDLGAVAAHCNEHRLELEPGDGRAYDAAHARYRDLFQALKPVFESAKGEPE